jgi:hypothetical protein
MDYYSTKKISDKLILEIVEALGNIRGWGSVEIFVQDHKVVQITERNIKKTTNTDQSRRTVKLGLDK